ncbi:unnamed protein product [Protopolystoma xenopodis]|uniref:Uncharacterized protein n=1 Tax=Protopolystoma xenopodis TaxID=117903 RepID=A0A448WYN6_9PLAT|nr:unnamed protein product [Protopolystoma xenopodis]
MSNVLDDEEPHSIWPRSVITLTVLIRRHPLYSPDASHDIKCSPATTACLGDLYGSEETGSAGNLYSRGTGNIDERSSDQDDAAETMTKVILWFTFIFLFINRAT